ncbi:MAG: 5'-3' exonuclease H3TH domain-containing protein [Pseudomonadota bacterium]|nr:5'-3' exonuclease H3TH domain-containing protein [Pseudomonadota bacterium]
MKDRVYLIDASVYIFRAWFSYPNDITDSSGHVVNAVHGYADFLTSLLKQLTPGYIACAFDGSLATSYRNEIYPPYKANRDPAPAELKYQFNLCRRLTRALGITEYSSDRFEADDILATMAQMMSLEGHPVTVITSDKDLTQLLQHQQDRWWDYARDTLLDHEGVETRFGVKPCQIADLLALAGDAVDNIPGIPGIGPKTAAGLLQRFNSLDGIFQHVDEVGDCGIRGAARIRKLLIEYEDDARLARQLTVVSDQVPLQSTPSCLDWHGVEVTQIEEFSDEVGFSRFRRRTWREMGRE